MPSNGCSLPLLSIPGLGPSTARLLYDPFHVTTLDELEQAAREHRLGGIPGIGDMSEESILKGIDSVRRTEERKKGV